MDSSTGSPARIADVVLRSGLDDNQWLAEYIKAYLRDFNVAINRLSSRQKAFKYGRREKR